MREGVGRKRDRDEGRGWVGGEIEMREGVGRKRDRDEGGVLGHINHHHERSEGSLE